MASYLKTYTGLKVDALNPDPDTIELRDIAHALSLNCRGNGQVVYFYSVAQHCINAYLEAVEQNYPLKVQIYCLLHDAAEAYVTDLIRPIKQYIPKYQEIEDTFLKAIFTHFELGEPTAEEWKMVKFVDDAILEYDLVYLLREPLPKEGFRTKRLPDLDYVKPTIIEKQFIEIANKLLSAYKEEQK